jgi:hypothetical protein
MIAQHKLITCHICKLTIGSIGTREVEEAGLIRIRYFIYLCTYDLYGPVHNVFDACRYNRGQVGGGLGPGNREFFGQSRRR